jgi:hypothetical protein
VLEDINYSAWGITTLKRIARAFDLRLRVRFEEFGTFEQDLSHQKSDLECRAFVDDPKFNKSESNTRDDHFPIAAITAVADYEMQAPELFLPQVQTLEGTYIASTASIQKALGTVHISIPKTNISESWTHTEIVSTEDDEQKSRNMKQQQAYTPSLAA